MCTEADRNSNPRKEVYPRKKEKQLSTSHFSLNDNLPRKMLNIKHIFLHFAIQNTIKV